MGPEGVCSHVGVNATGFCSNSLQAVEHSVDGKTNPMVNSCHHYDESVPGDTIEEKWESVRETLSRFAGRTLTVDEEISTVPPPPPTIGTAHHPSSAQQAPHLLRPGPALDLDTEAKLSLGHRPGDLAVMGATLADGGSTLAPGHR